MLPEQSEWQQDNCQWHGSDIINRMKLYLKNRTNELCQGIVSKFKLVFAVLPILPFALFFNSIKDQLHWIKN